MNTETEVNPAALAECKDVRFAPSPMIVKAINEDEREVLHLISTNSRDRMGDIVEPKGVKLQNYRKNPIVLVNHSYNVESIIGRSTMIESSDDGLYSRTRFLDTPLADAAYRLAKEKLGGWSIGFDPVKSHTIKEGKDQKCAQCSAIFDELAKGKEPGDYMPGQYDRHYMQWELLEYSAVAIPANQDVVNNAIRLGLPEALISKFFRVGDVKVAGIPETARATPAQPAADGPTAEPAPTDYYRPSEPVRTRLRSALDRHYARVRHGVTADRVADVLRSREP